MPELKEVNEQVIRLRDAAERLAGYKSPYLAADVHVIRAAADNIEALQRQVAESALLVSTQHGELMAYLDTITQLRSGLSTREAEVVALREAIQTFDAGLDGTYNYWFRDDKALLALRASLTDTAPTASAIRGKWRDEAIEEAALLVDAYNGVHHCVSDEIRALKGQP